MKGLLCKDLTELLSPLKLALTAGLLLGGILLKMPYLIACIALVFGVLPVDSMQRDAVSRWETQQMTLPVSRFRIVTEKYLLILLCTAISAGVMSFGMLWITMHYLITAGDFVLWIVRACLCCFLIPALVCPICFRFGYAKGRLVMLLLIVFFATVTATELAVPEAELVHGLIPEKLLYSWLPNFMERRSVIDFLQTIHRTRSSAYITAAILGSAVLTVLSWLLSIRGFSRREF